jgi:hypothetical protein
MLHRSMFFKAARAMVFLRNFCETADKGELHAWAIQAKTPSR